MKFEQLIAFVKKQGCLVRTYKNKSVMAGSSSVGTFDVSKRGNPIICIAKKGHTSAELLMILLHEYAHFCQWRSGFMQLLEDISPGHDIFDRWLAGQNFSIEHIKRSRNVVLLMEYDAELRTIDLAEQLSINLNAEDYFDNAHSYITHIKYAYLNRKWSPGYSILNIKQSEMSPREVIAPITQFEIDTIVAEQMEEDNEWSK